MILTADVGNTSIGFGCVEGREVRLTFEIEMSRSKTEYEYAVLLERILSLRGVAPRGFEGAVLASVVPPHTRTVRAAIYMVTGLRALVLGAGVRTGLNIGIDDPSQLGADLVAGAVAALETREPPVIIVSMGTATTMMVIGRSARVLGGAILPGAGLSLDALSEAASLLPRVAIERPKRCIGTNTAECMRSGATFGAAAAIDGMIERMERELDSRAAVVATGGHARSVIPCCQRPIELDDTLILRGLAMIWEKNKK